MGEARIPLWIMNAWWAVAVLGLSLCPPARQNHADRSPPVVMNNPLARFNPFNPSPKEPESALTNGMDELLKDAPLPVKVLGGIVKPLIAGLGAALRESQAQSESLLQEAQGALRADSRVASLLGGDVVVGATFSQSSSNVNGAVSLALQCQLSGKSGEGVVSIRGQGGNGDVYVTSLVVQVNGQQFEVPTLRGGGGGDVSGGAGDSGVIDIEVVQ